MNTLLLRFSAPMQSWGLNSKFDRRLTLNVPTRSAILGFIASSMGIQRQEEIGFLREGLKIGIRVDREGELLRDYQTVKSSSSAYVTHRYYLNDAVFLVGIEGELLLLRSIEKSIQNPAYPLFLGRRSCPPEGRVVIGLRENTTLIEALESEPYLLDISSNKKEIKSVQLRIVMDSDSQDSQAFLQKDNPVSFDFRKRVFDNRFVVERFIKLQLDEKQSTMNVETVHNPWNELEV